MKKILVNIIMCSFLVLMCSSCLNGELIWADNSVTRTSNIDVIVKENTEKQFVLGVDEQQLVEKYSQFGSLTMLNVLVKGQTSIDTLKESLTGICYNENNMPIVCTNNDEIDYYTDWIKVKIYMPKNAYYVNFDDGQNLTKIEKATMVEDTYVKKNFEWIKADKLKTNFYINTNSLSDNAYYLIEFYDQDKNVISRYFLNIEFNVTII